MDLFQLEAFVTVVREGSFSKAATALYRTQPAVSQIIRRLEDEIGQSLFDRSSRRGVLTDAGQVLLEHAERLMNFKEQALAAVADVRHLRRGQLVIAANELTCLYLLPLLHEYRRLHPEVRLSIRRSLASRIPAEVRDYGADLGVVTYQPADTDLESVVVYHDQLAFVVPRGHRFTKRREVSIKDLGAEAFVAHHVSSPYRAKVVETFRKRRVTLQMPVETRSRSSLPPATASRSCRRLLSKGNSHGANSFAFVCRSWLSSGRCGSFTVGAAPCRTPPPHFCRWQKRMPPGGADATHSLASSRGPSGKP